MEVASSALFIAYGLLAASIVAGITLLGRPLTRNLGLRVLRVFAWLLVVFGTALTTAIAGLQITGRLGPAQVWFRAPAFYFAIATLLAVATWWFRRRVDHPHPRLIRFAVPAFAFLAIAVVVVVHRLDRRSAPLAAFMPTMRLTAPEIRFQQAGGEMHRLSDFRGQVVLVNFWATWCVPCRREMPMLSAAQTEFRSDGLVVIYLSLEEPDMLASFLGTNHFEGLQGRLTKADDYYRAGQIYPLSYLISRDGRVAKRWSGRPAENWLRDSIRAEL